MNYLISNRYKGISAIVFYTSTILGICLLYFLDGGSDLPSNWKIPVPALWNDTFLSTTGDGVYRDHIWNELVAILLIISGLGYGFSKERVEDELIGKIRTNALVWSLFWNYGALILATIFVYGLPYFQVMTYQLFSILILFNLRYQWMLKKHYAANHEE